jgi:hypothetical protein
MIRATPRAQERSSVTTVVFAGTTTPRGLILFSGTAVRDQQALVDLQDRFEFDGLVLEHTDLHGRGTE